MPLDTMTATMQTAVFRAEEPLRLPAYKGSTFRGALGHAFKQVSCALRREHCDTCLLKHRCAYSVCFETPVPEGAEIMRRYPSAPHPFVLEPPADDRQLYESGEELAVRLWLVGSAGEYLPYFIYAFDEMGKRGLGRDRGKAVLTRVETGADAACLYTEETQNISGKPECWNAATIEARVEDLRGKPLKIYFETPMRVKSENRLTESCTMSVLAPSLVRRLHTLAYFFCGASWTKDIGALLDLSAQVDTLEENVQWMDWTRYSARQDTTMQLGGFIGEALYSPVPAPLLLYLCWGEALHLGKGSAFGQGKYQIHAV